MNKAILIQADDWEGLFINGCLVDEGHTLNEGEERAVYFSKLADEHYFQVKNMESGYVTDDYYDNKLSVHGSFDADIKDVDFK